MPGNSFYTVFIKKYTFVICLPANFASGLTLNLINIMKHHFLYLGILLILTSCCGYPTEVEEALHLAGENRHELIEVLKYSKRKGDIAYKSACFLIGNMKYHESKNEIFTDSIYHRYFADTDSVFRIIFGNMSLYDIQHHTGKGYDSIRKALASSFNQMINNKAETRSHLADLQTIRADFLIDNIESALNVWYANGYEYEKDFNFFKEFILPYRTTNEYPELNRSKIHDMYVSIIADSDALSIRDQLERYKVYVEKCRWINKYIKPKKHLGIYDLFVSKFKMDCHNMTNWSCNVLRSCGIPTVYEFTPKWTDRDSRHFWCVSPDSTGILKPYTAPDNNLLEDWESDIKYAGKVYRRTFGAQKDTPYFIADKEEFIPEPFQNPLLSDQTFRYHQTVTLRIPLKMNVTNKLAYLCMFTSHNDLTPVGWGKIDLLKKEIVFEQVPLNTLFFPVCYDNDTMLEISEPFMLHTSGTINNIPLPLTQNKQEKALEVSFFDGKLHLDDKERHIVEEIQYMPLKCDTSIKQNLHLLRKYPSKRRMKALREKLKGGCLVGSNQEKKNYDTLLVLQNMPEPYLQELAFENQNKYRFYRFIGINGPANIAHMEFLGGYSPKHVCTHPTPLPIFSEEETSVYNAPTLYRINGNPLPTGSNPETAFDNNFNTYSGASSIGMDFTNPVQINRIRFVPRNANNGIVPGDSYLLQYYNNGWKEFKILYAEYNYLDFKDVPSATLYWLQNLSDGKEELPFFYRNGKQYFLHTDSLPINF